MVTDPDITPDVVGARVHDFGKQFPHALRQGDFRGVGGVAVNLELQMRHPAPGEMGP